MNEWIFVAQQSNYKYSIDSVFKRTNTLEIGIKQNVYSGDVVYIYLGGYENRIKYKCKVTVANLQKKAKEFQQSKNNRIISSRNDLKFIRLKLIESYDEEYYSLGCLLGNGFKMKEGMHPMSQELGKYIAEIKRYNEMTELAGEEDSALGAMIEHLNQDISSLEYEFRKQREDVLEIEDIELSQYIIRSMNNEIRKISDIQKDLSQLKNLLVDIDVN